MQALAELETPALLLDRQRMAVNIARLRERLDRQDVRLRPHLKTTKCIEIARQLMEAPDGPAAVSTVQEAEYFSGAGVQDVLYAVGIGPGKAERLSALKRLGANPLVVVESVDQARWAVAADLPVLIEIDVDGHRSGVEPESPALFEIAEILGPRLRGVMAHAGESYRLSSPGALADAAEQERFRTVLAATRLRAVGHDAPIVSIGSTPTAHFARNLEGVTEVRAGVFVFFDLVMAGIGVCKLRDIAISVLATVIGIQPDRQRYIIDAGWMALSADRGTATQAVDQGYGLVCDVAGTPYGELIVSSVNQEHGIVSLRADARSALPKLEIGSRVRILPNHACATASQHDGYHVLEDDQQRVCEYWPRIRGW